jgi:hypothetical protein
MSFEKRLAEALQWVIPEKKRPTVIAVDLDGTLARELDDYDPDEIGPPVHNAKKIMDKVKDLDVCIVINTCRGDEKLIKSWFKDHDIPYDHINENPHQPSNTSDKIMADRYWDNKQPSWRGLQYAYEELKRLLSRNLNEEYDEYDEYEDLEDEDEFEDTGETYDQACQDMEYAGHDIAEYLNRHGYAPDDWVEGEEVIVPSRIQPTATWSEEGQAFLYGHADTGPVENVWDEFMGSVYYRDGKWQHEWQTHA